jgi:hypothetical protein
MPLIAQAGASTVRIEFPWTFIETSQGVYDWSRADYIVNAASQNGVQLQPVVAFCPAWEGPPNCVPNPDDFSRFVSALTSRYRGRVHVWEFGNEPDLSRYFNGTEAQWISTMLNPGFAAAKAVDGSNTVVSSGMAYPGNLGWIDVLKANGARFDVQAYHDYPGSASQVNSDGWALRNRMNADGYTNVPLWLDEFGTQENTITDTNQQSWLKSVYSPGANPSVNIKWYNLRDDNIYCGYGSVCKSDFYGLYTRDLQPKQGVTTYRSVG